jgi:hypothetical protein
MRDSPASPAKRYRERLSMPEFHVVTMDDKEDEITPADLERLTVAVAGLRGLVNDPVALIERARALLEGEALRLI